MVEYDPFDWETAHNPYPVYRRLRDEAPVYYKDAPFLIVKDPPEHTAHRKIVGRLFIPRRIAELEPFVRRTASTVP